VKYAYYPGCSLEATAKEYDMSVKEVFKALGVELKEIEDWNCCGASAAYSIDHLLSLSLAARNLALAEKENMDILAPCPECYLREWETSDSIKMDRELLDKMNKALEGTGLKVKGSIDVKHPLDVIVNDIGIEKLAEKVVNSLNGLKVAPYYGCVIVRPPRNKRFDSPERPTSMDRIIEAVGATVAPFQHKVKCCGGALMMANEGVQMKLSREILLDAKENADCIITACPLCHMALDARQMYIEKEYNEKIEVPVLYFTQLIGLALGITPKKLGLDKNFVPTKKIINSVKLASK
jgi:heterodisulfide reductase subunit B